MFSQKSKQNNQYNKICLEVCQTNIVVFFLGSTNTIKTIDFKKWVLSANYDHYFSCWCVHFDHVFGWDSEYVYHELRTERVGIFPKSSKYRQRIVNTIDFLSLCKLSFKKNCFQRNISGFSITDASILTPCSDGIQHTYATS